MKSQQSRNSLKLTYSQNQSDEEVTRQRKINSERL